MITAELSRSASLFFPKKIPPPNKLSELEEQFKILTNNFEEINFKLDKLSSRITKVQTDNQMRFQDLEKPGLNQTTGSVSSGIKKLPGSGEPQD